MPGFLRSSLRVGLGLFVLGLLGWLAQTLSPLIGVQPSNIVVTLAVIAALLAVAWLWLGGD